MLLAKSSLSRLAKAARQGNSFRSRETEKTCAVCVVRTILNKWKLFVSKCVQQKNEKEEKQLPLFHSIQIKQYYIQC